MITACTSAYYWATAAGVVGVAWAIAFAAWAFWRHGGDFELELSDPESPRTRRRDDG